MREELHQAPRPRQELGPEEHDELLAARDPQRQALERDRDRRVVRLRDAKFVCAARRVANEKGDQMLRQGE